MPGGTDEERLTLLREEATFAARQVETGRVIVTTEVEEREEPVEAVLRREELSVERVPVGRIVSEMPAVRQEGDVLIVPVVEEQLVIETRLLLREEIHVRKEVHVEPVRELVTLRAEKAVVTRHAASHKKTEQTGPEEDRDV
jgi:uncharacterized protein (TIGR02271 family)